MAIHVGATFATWRDFKDALHGYSQESFTVWSVRSNRSVEVANKRLKQGPYYKPELVNAYARLQCKHHGSVKSASSGQRPQQRLVCFCVKFHVPKLIGPRYIILFVPGVFYAQPYIYQCTKCRAHK